MSSKAAPLWICFLPQFVSVVGDCFGQRSSRVYHNYSRRRFVIALVAVTTTQMLLVLTIFQLAAPSITTPISEKRNGTTHDFCASDAGRGSRYCYAQGPLTIYRAVDLCPMLLVNGLLNIVYYVGEATLYKQSLGVFMLVLCALTSSFIVAPLQAALGLDHGGGPTALAIVMGIAGALLCLFERDAPGVPPPAVGLDEQDGKGDGVGLVDDDEEEGTGASGGIAQPDAGAEASPSGGAPSPSASSLQTVGYSSREETPLVIKRGEASATGGEAEVQATRGAALCSTPTVGGRGVGAPADASTGARARAAAAALCRNLPLLIPFFSLSFVYALYFVLMDYYNSKCKMNLWGYNAYDQVTLPLYVFTAFALIDTIGPCKQRLEAPSDRHESFVQAFRGAMGELFGNRAAGFLNMFVYRFLINSRAMAYTYIATSYNLSASYLELTLIRVVVSWLASLLLILLIPRFIETGPHEQRRMKDKLNIGLKVVGTTAIVGSLFLIHKDSE